MQSGQPRSKPEPHFSHTLNTSSAVFRTMNDRGSDYGRWRLESATEMGSETSWTHCLVHSKSCLRSLGKDAGVRTYLWPNPDKVFSRFFTASMKAGTFSGLEDVMSKSAVMRSDHQPPNGDQHPDHGLVGTAWSPVKMTCKLEKKNATHHEAAR